MASYTVAEAEVSAPNKTLVASTVDTVTFQPDVEWFEVISSGDAQIFVTIDGSAPSASPSGGGGNAAYVVPAYPCTRVIRHWQSGGVVKLLSTGTPTYTLTRV